MSTIDFQIYNTSISSGLDRCVVYTESNYECWYGLVYIDTENEIDSSVVYYVDGNPLRQTLGTSVFKGKLGCYFYPELIDDSYFGMTYRVYTNLSQTEYELHLVYNCRSKLNGVTSASLSSTPNIPGFVLDLSTLPFKRPFNGFAPASHIVISSSDIWVEAIKSLEDILYGTKEVDPRMPTIDEVISVLEEYVSLRITDHGDGTWTAEEINVTGLISIDQTNRKFEISSSSAMFIDDFTYTIASI